MSLYDLLGIDQYKADIDNARIETLTKLIKAARETKTDETLAAIIVYIVRILKD